jgi:hypothetical protein
MADPRKRLANAALQPSSTVPARRVRMLLIPQQLIDREGNQVT